MKKVYFLLTFSQQLVAPPKSLPKFYFTSTSALPTQINLEKNCIFIVKKRFFLSFFLL